MRNGAAKRREGRKIRKEHLQTVEMRETPDETPEVASAITISKIIMTRPSVAH